MGSVRGRASRLGESSLGVSRLRRTFYFRRVADVDCSERAPRSRRTEARSACTSRVLEAKCHGDPPSDLSSGSVVPPPVLWVLCHLQNCLLALETPFPPRISGVPYGPVGSDSAYLRQRYTESCWANPRLNRAWVFYPLTRWIFEHAHRRHSDRALSAVNALTAAISPPGASESRTAPYWWSAGALRRIRPCAVILCGRGGRRTRCRAPPLLLWRLLGHHPRARWRSDSTTRAVNPRRSQRALDPFSEQPLAELCCL